MQDWYIAVILGLVEGVTEFLPVSSTGHLIITGHLLGFSGPRAASFEVVIQLGAILAVVVLYRHRFLGLLAQDAQHAFSGKRGLFLLFLTSLPASLLGLVAHDTIKEYLFTPVTVAWALAGGAIAIVFTERYTARSGRYHAQEYQTLDDISPAMALGIGVFQCLALWPGFSRSAATIMGGMLLGCQRTVAAQYSFIAAVPLMVAATGYELLNNYGLFTRDDIYFLGTGFCVSFFAAWFAVKAFIHLLERVTLRPFAFYRLLLALAVLFFAV